MVKLILLLMPDLLFLSEHPRPLTEECLNSICFTARAMLYSLADWKAFCAGISIYLGRSNAKGNQVHA